MKRYLGLIVTLLFIFGTGCSTKKNTWAHRAYHNTTSYYNIYFNGKEAFKKGVTQIETAYRDDYTKVLPIYRFGSPEASQAGFGEMDRAIKKASKLIEQHSIRVKPKVPKKSMSKKQREFYKKTEYNKWVDDAYLLMGKAYLHQREFAKASQALNVVLRKFPKTESESLANLWQWRTYTERLDFIQAERYMNFCMQDAFLKKEFPYEMAANEAAYYLKQQKYEQAIQPLKNALALAKRKDRLRINFILAQIYLEKNEQRKATRLFAQVAKSNSNYEMAFNARLQQALSYDQSAGGYSKLIDDLKDLAKDEKNEDFLNRIYFAQATVAKKREKTDEAIEYFQKAAQAPGDDANLKAEAYLAVADIYFGQHNYKQSGAFYDSTMTQLSQQHPNYTEISTKAQSLTTLAKNMLLIEREDSLQNLARMDEEERNKIIDDQIEEVKKAEIEKQRQEQLERVNSGFDPNRVSTSRNQQAFGSGWYFYNASALSQGETEFKRKWGTRRLSDHWRRRNKSVVEQMAENSEEENGQKNGKTAANDPKKRDFYLKDLPESEADFAASDKKIEEALLQNGNIYRDDVNDVQEAVDSYKALVKRFPKGDNALDALYNLYIISQSVGNNAQANRYKQQIIRDFPDSNRAKALQDPAYASRLKNARQHTETAYGKAFELYQQNNTNVALQTINKAQGDFPNNHLAAKFSILKAMCIGKQKNIDAYKKQLKLVIKNYPQSEVVTLAKEMLKVAEKGKIDGERVVEEIYKVQPGAKHYSAIAVKTEKEANQLVFLLGNYNADYSKTKAISTKKQDIAGNSHFLIVMSPFADALEANKHLVALQEEKSVNEKTKKAESFLISERNLKELQKDGDLQKYLDFYRANY